jgi:hypothetical protein
MSLLGANPGVETKATSEARDGVHAAVCGRREYLFFYVWHAQIEWLSAETLNIILRI